MDTFDKDPPNDLVKEKDDLNDSDKPCAKTKHETEPFTEPRVKERSSNLDDPRQVEAIYHYLLIVADENYSDKDRAAAAEHLAIHYFKRPIYPMAWLANQAYITKELKGPGKSRIKYKERIEREITCLFLSIDVMEKGQGKRDAVKAVRNKLNKEMLKYLLGEEWRTKSREAEITGLGVGEGRDDIPINFLFQDPVWKIGWDTTEGMSEEDYIIFCEKTLELKGCDEGVIEWKKIGDGEQPKEVLGLEVDKQTREWRKARVDYHHGVVDIEGKPSEAWADVIGSGARSRVSDIKITAPDGLSGPEIEIFLEQVIRKAKLSEFQRDVILAVHNGMSQTEYARLHNIKPTRVWKEKERATKKMIIAKEILENS